MRLWRERTSLVPFDHLAHGRVGMIGFIRKDDVAEFYGRPRQEYRGEDWIENYLEQLTSGMSDHFAKMLDCQVTYCRGRDSWLT